MRYTNVEWTRTNLGAGPLGSYAFRVEATLGHRPMTYLFARSMEPTDTKVRAVTVLLVVAPAVLAGTRITISETFGPQVPEVTTFLPTMRQPKTIAGAYLFECLPLTDVGYIDLTAWLHPPAHDEPAGSPPTWSQWHHRPGMTTRQSTAAHGYEVTETVSEEHCVAVARGIALDGEETRRWEALELGDAEFGHLPVGIRVSRPRTGHWTAFERTTQPRPIRPEWLAADFETLRDAINGELEG